MEDKRRKERFLDDLRPSHIDDIHIERGTNCAQWRRYDDGDTVWSIFVQLLTFNYNHKTGLLVSTSFVLRIILAPADVGHSSHILYATAVCH